MTAGYVILWLTEDSTIAKISEIVFKTHEEAEEHLSFIDESFMKNTKPIIRWWDIRRVSVS